MKENKFIISQYDVIKKLGEGSFGKAFLCSDKQNSEKVVIKEIYLDNHDISSRKRIIQEGPTLFQLSHLNIIKFKQFFFDDSIAYLIMQYADGGDLNKEIKDKISKGEYFEEKQILKWF